MFSWVDDSKLNDYNRRRDYIKIIEEKKLSWVILRVLDGGGMGRGTGEEYMSDPDNEEKTYEI